jgi:hypothetical protein
MPEINQYFVSIFATKLFKFTASLFPEIDKEYGKNSKS